MGFYIFIVAFHASDRDHGRNKIASFWESISRLFSKFIKHSDFVLFVGDANGQLGEYLSSAVGEHCGAGEDDSGSCLHDVCSQRRLWLPSTFKCCSNNLL